MLKESFFLQPPSSLDLTLGLEKLLSITEQGLQGVEAILPALKELCVS